MRPEVAKVAESPAMAAASPAARDWILRLLAEGERAGMPAAVGATPATGRGRCGLTAVGRDPRAAGEFRGKSARLNGGV
jgi:hypothetical protein